MIALLIVLPPASLKAEQVDEAVAVPQERGGIAVSQLEVEILPKIDADAGARKGGFICLPNGRFEVESFVASERELRAALVMAFLEAGSDRPMEAIQRVALQNVRVDLCARNFMPGKSGQYSGTARFEFLVTWRGGESSLEAIDLEIPRKGALTEREILHRATSDLVAGLLSSTQS